MVRRDETKAVCEFSLFLSPFLTGLVAQKQHKGIQVDLCRYQPNREKTNPRLALNNLLELSICKEMRCQDRICSCKVLKYGKIYQSKTPEPVIIPVA